MVYSVSMRLATAAALFVFALFFIVGVFIETDSLSPGIDPVSKEVSPRHHPSTQTEECDHIISFEAVANRFVPVSDKVTIHKYGSAYDTFLPRFLSHKRKVRLLEIGLGCSMTYGPGASIPVWREYFKQSQGGVEIHVFEIDRVCGERWQHDHGMDVIMHYGDQSNIEDLRQLFALDLDIIVDDGGHSWNMQIISFQQLFPKALVSKGVYFLEDTLTSYPLSWFPEGQFAKGPQTTVNYIKGLLDDLHEMAPDELRHAEATALRSLSCWDSICVFEKG